MNRKPLVILLAVFFVSFECLHADEKTDLYVTGALSPTGLERVGKPLSVVTSDEIRRSGSATIGDILAAEPGVSSTSFGPGASRPVIRGQGKERVRIIENGLESGDVSKLSDDHSVAIESGDLQRIDILRGPSTLLYGSGAIGGVVNLIDRSIAEESVDAPVRGTIELAGGDHADDRRNAFGALRGNIGKFNWYFSAFNRDSGDIEIPGFAESSELRAEEGESEEESSRRRLENSAARSHGGRVGGSWVWDTGFWGVSYRHFDSRYGVPGGHGHHHEEGEHEEEESLFDSEEGDEATKIDMTQRRWETRGESRFDGSYFKRVRWGGSLTRYDHNELEGEEVGTRYTNESIEGRVELVHGHREGREGGWGVQFNTDKLAASGEEAFVPSSRTTSPSVFMVEEFALAEQVVWEIGGRYEYSEVDPVDARRADFNLFSLATGLKWKPQGALAALTVSLSERAPNATELFADGAHLATQTYEVGSESLTRERSIGVEALIKKTDGRARGSLSAFVQQFSDFIALNPTGESEDELPVYQYGMTRARFFGGEVTWEYDLIQDDAQRLTLLGQIDYVRAKDTVQDSPLPRITPLRGRVGAEYRRGPLGVNINFDVADDQNRVAEFERATDGYTSTSAHVSYDVYSKGSSMLTFFLQGTNLTDEEIRVHNSFLKDVAPLRGRAVLAGLTVNF